MRILFTLLFVFALAGCETTHKAYLADTKVPGGTHHYVRSGETLWGISKSYGVDIKSILAANDIHDAANIERGQRILIPGTQVKTEAPKVNYSGNDFFMWPARGAVLSFYGSKTDHTRNKGIDIGASEGANVRAARSGKVVFCDDWLKGFGKTVILDHGDEFQTVYAYNSAILVNIGDIVEQNAVIAKVGRSGRAKTPSLHFEIRRDGEPQNPFYYLSR
jgi:murein DD-endopeptidase MepM/ murein hydrolase activator NlpD